MSEPVARRPSTIHVVLLVWCCCLLLIAGLDLGGHNARVQAAETLPAGPVGAPTTAPKAPTTKTPPETRPTPTTLPGGRLNVFDGQFLVAYYGIAGSGVLGVLGEAAPDRIWPRLVRAAAPFARPGERVQPVFELIVNVATRGPGPDGDYSGEIPRAAVRQYIEAAHKHGALVILDLQPGRSDFLRLAKRWKWALENPWVGLALDPEWRIGPHQLPGRVIGSVGAAEVNRVSAWLERLTVRENLPQKVFMLHQFRLSMIRNPGLIKDRPHLAMVQHVDGFGTPHEKLSTYHVVARPHQFHEGFKLFYDEDVDRMSAARVLKIRPRVSFVSFQ